MIIDNIKNASRYILNERFEKAFQYIQNTNLNNLPTGKHEIDGDEVFALCLEYETKNQADCILEAHYKYIDLQYIVSGEEFMGLTQLTNQMPYEMNHDHDYAFYKDDVSLVKFTPSMFAIFFPNDLHMTSIKTEKAQPLKKIVVKIKM